MCAFWQNDFTAGFKHSQSISIYSRLLTHRLEVGSDLKHSTHPRAQCSCPPRTSKHPLQRAETTWPIRLLQVLGPCHGDWEKGLFLLREETAIPNNFATVLVTMQDLKYHSDFWEHRHREGLKQGPVSSSAWDQSRTISCTAGCGLQPRLLWISKIKPPLLLVS